VKSPGAAFINTTNPFDLKVGYPMGLKRGFNGILMESNGILMDFNGILWDLIGFIRMS